MKSQRTNAFQLAIAGAVLVLVIICATFAWFAVGDHAFVNDISASVASPDVPSQLNSIQYKKGDDWELYDGGELSIIPGQEWAFKISFTAKTGDPLKINLSDLSASARVPETTSQDDGNQSEENKTEYTTVISDNMLSDVLEIEVYEVDKNGNETQIPDSSKALANGLMYEETITTDDGNVQTLSRIYKIKMKENAGNIYMDKLLSFVIGVTLGNESIDETT